MKNLLTNNPGVWLISAVLALAGGSRAARAQPTFTAGVVCTLPTDVATTLYGADAAAVQKLLSAEMADQLNQRLTFWHFEASDTGHFPRLDVHLINGTKWELSAHLLAAENAPETAFWEGVIYEPGELSARGGIPTADELRDELIERFDTKLLARHQADMRENLKLCVPLDCVATLPLAPALSTDGPGRSLLPLPWKKYQPLSQSFFRVECNWADREMVNLRSRGVGKCSAFSGTPAFEGIVVEHLEWGGEEINNRLAHLPELQLMRVYLDKYQFSTGGIQCGGAAPAIFSPNEEDEN